MKIFVSCLFIIFCLILTRSSLAGSRSQIEIMDAVYENNTYTLEIFVIDATPDTDVVIFTESERKPGLKLVSTLAERKTEIIWSATFEEKEKISSIYAISATRRKEHSSEWQKKDDLSALRSLGIEKLGSIDDVLELLDNFGWSPTGYTFVGETRLRKPFSKEDPNQNSTTNLCVTTKGMCTMVEYGPIGVTCYCNFASGPVDGITVEP